MYLRRLTVSLALIAAVFTASGCGEGGGGGGSQFKTVVVTATALAPGAPYQLKTGNTCPSPTPADGTFFDETTSVAIASTKYPTLTTEASRIFIDSYTVTFSPARTGYPAIPDFIGSSVGTGFNVPGGAVNVTVMSAAYKQDLVNRSIIQLCSGNVYEYFATISFTVREENSGTSKNVSTSMNVQITD
jgi:hypothetical protein